MPPKGSTKTSRLLKSMARRPEPKAPIATDMFLPNNSGVTNHPETKANLVPYTGANKDVDLGLFQLFADDLIATETLNISGGALEVSSAGALTTIATIDATGNITSEASIISDTGVFSSAEGSDVWTMQTTAEGTENLQYTFSNTQIDVGSSTGINRIIYDAIDINTKDNTQINFGNSEDVGMSFKTTGVDSFRMYIKPGSRNIQIMDSGDFFVNFGLGAHDDPYFIIHSTSSAADDIKAIAFTHDATDANVIAHTGGIRLLPVTDGNVTIGAGGDEKLILPKSSSAGIQIDTATPTFGFADIIGDQFSKNTGSTKPTLATYNGTIKAWQFGQADEAYISYHIPHDYVKGTDIHLHIHWSQTSATATGGTIDFKYFAIYAKAHNQTTGSTFTTTPKTATVTTIDINDGASGLNQYQQFLTEVTISGASANAAIFDRDDFEPDGIIELTFEMDVNNLTNSVTVLDPFIHFVDIHYQSTGLIGTKDKAPDFYA